MTDRADALLSGPRGRRMCAEYVARTDDAVRSALFWLGRELDPQAGFRFAAGDASHRSHREDDPTFTGDELAALINAADRSAPIRADIVRESLQASVDLARYWQEPDGEDAVAALPAVRSALRRVAERLLATVTPEPTATSHTAQWAVDWHPLSDTAPLEYASAAALAKWTRTQREDEARAARERPADPRANISGIWWSVPQGLLTTRGSILDALELVEDFPGWAVATVVPVRGVGETLEIESARDWADLCREYPMDVTASRRHDWFRVTGREKKWLIPDWQRVSERWDAVHLTTLGYLSAATQLIDIDVEHASVIGGWAPDSTVWLTDVARESDDGREQWSRSRNGWRWTRDVLPN